MRITARLAAAALALCLWCQPAYAQITVVASDGQAASAADSTTTDGINTSGANLLVVGCSWYGGTDTTATVTDSKSNSWSAATQSDATPLPAYVQFFYSVPTSVGSGHTFTCSATGGFTAMGAIAFSGADSTPLESQNKDVDAGFVTSIDHNGGFTPDSNDQVVLSGVVNADGPFTINGGFTEFADITFSGGTTMGALFSYLIQTTAAAANPTVSWGSGSATATVLISFDVGVGGLTLGLMGVGR